MTTADEPFNATNRRELAPILGRVENAGRVLALHVDETEWLPCSLELQHDDADEGAAASSGRILGPGGDRVCSHHLLRTRPLFLALFVMRIVLYAYCHRTTGGYFYYATQTSTDSRSPSATCRSAPSLWSAGKRATNDRTFCRCAAARALPRRSEKQPTAVKSALLAPGCGSSSTPRGPSGRLLPRTGARPAASAVGLLRAVPSRSA